MNVVAYSQAVTLPVPMHSVSRDVEIEQKSHFAPGMPVKVILEAGGEHDALLRWSE